MRLTYKDYIKYNSYNIYLALNSVSYYCIWFLCLFYVIKHNFPYYLQAAFILNFIQFSIYFKLTKNKLKFCFFVFLVTILAFIIDSLFFFLRIVIYNKNDFFYISPLWLLLMWNNFAITFYITSRFLFNRALILGILALIFVPLAYYYVIFFNAMYIKSYYVLISYGLIWSILLPVICYLDKKVFNDYENFK